jgi:protein disulfide-isomerase
MRLTSFTLLSGLAAFGLFGSSVAADDDSKAPKETYFDSLPVPPLTELTPKNFEEVANQTKWLLVKHYRYDDTPSSSVAPCGPL